MRTMLAWIVSLTCLAVAAAAQQPESTGEVFDFDRDHPAAGAWVGSATTGAGQAVFLAMTARRGDNDQWSVRITALAGGLLHTECTEIQSSGSEFAFTLPGGNARFAGVISDDGQALRGTITSTADEAPENEPQPFTLRRTMWTTDLPEPLAFSGELSAQGIGLPMTIVLARTPGGNWVGHLDVPMQMLREFPFINVKQGEEGTITADLPVPGGAAIEVRIDELEKRLTGLFRQSGLEMEIDFTRDMNYSYRELVRSQNPRPPLPYEEREITAAHPGGFSLGGTLTIPSRQEFGEGPFPVAVLISGSGQQDRNESLLGHQPFLIVADYLTRHGIAVMRYDDRGVGASRVDDMALVLEATSEDFATDALAVVEHLKTISEIDGKRIGLIGHSEGAIIAPMVAGMCDDIAFIVLLAGPGVVGSEVIVKQAELLMRVSGMDEADIEAQAVIRRELNEALVAGEDDERALALLRRLIEMQKDEQGEALTEEHVRRALTAAGKTMLNPWMKFFLGYDPLPALLRTTCPVLALNGMLDLQVWHEQNLEVIERAMKDAGRDITAIRYEGLNHLFQPAGTGAFAEYVRIETTFDEQVLADIVEWIEEKVGPLR